jgi:hypothetical protein
MRPAFKRLALSLARSARTAVRLSEARSPLPAATPAAASSVSGFERGTASDRNVMRCLPSVAVTRGSGPRAVRSERRVTARLPLRSVSVPPWSSRAVAAICAPVTGSVIRPAVASAAPLAVMRTSAAASRFAAFVDGESSSTVLPSGVAAAAAAGHVSATPIASARPIPRVRCIPSLLV